MKSVRFSKDDLQGIVTLCFGYLFANFLVKRHSVITIFINVLPVFVIFILVSFRVTIFRLICKKIILDEYWSQLIIYWTRANSWYWFTGCKLTGPEKNQLAPKSTRQDKNRHFQQEQLTPTKSTSPNKNKSPTKINWSKQKWTSPDVNQLVLTKLYLSWPKKLTSPHEN